MFNLVGLHRYSSDKYNYLLSPKKVIWHLSMEKLGFSEYKQKKKIVRSQNVWKMYVSLSWFQQTV